MAAHALAEAWKEVLPVSHRKALYSAFIELIDNYFMSDDKQDSLIGDGLPRKYRHRYTELFIQRFFASLMTVGYKLAPPRPSTPLLSCTAEELACGMILNLAEIHLEENGVKADFDLFEEDICQDNDLKLLYRADVDGIEDSPEFAYSGIGHLRLEEWFLHFETATTAVDPYSDQ